MTTTYFATQITNTRAGTLNPSTTGGPLVVKYFDYTIPAATLAVADLLMWGFIPKGARFREGLVHASAMGVAATANIGSYTVVAAPVVITAAKYGALTDMTLVSRQTFGQTIALSYGVLETTDVYIGIVTAAQICPAAGTFKGEYSYWI
jgi:hypothetical protein